MRHDGLWLRRFRLWSEIAPPSSPEPTRATAISLVLQEDAKLSRQTFWLYIIYNYNHALNHTISYNIIQLIIPWIIHCSPNLSQMIHWARMGPGPVRCHELWLWQWLQRPGHSSNSSNSSKQRGAGVWESAVACNSAEMEVNSDGQLGWSTRMVNFVHVFRCFPWLFLDDHHGFHHFIFISTRFHAYPMCVYIYIYIHEECTTDEQLTIVCNRVKRVN